MPALSSRELNIVLAKIHCYANNGDPDTCPKNIECPFSPQECENMKGASD